MIAWLVLVFLPYGDARSLNFLCLAPFFNLMPRVRKKPLNIAIFAFGSSGNQTRAACEASECSIHHTIASRLTELLFYLSLSLIKIVAMNEMTGRRKSRWRANIFVPPDFSFQGCHNPSQLRPFFSRPHVKDQKRPLPVKLFFSPRLLLNKTWMASRPSRPKQKHISLTLSVSLSLSLFSVCFSFSVLPPNFCPKPNQRVQG